MEGGVFGGDDEWVARGACKGMVKEDGEGKVTGG